MLFDIYWASDVASCKLVKFVGLLSEICLQSFLLLEIFLQFCSFIILGKKKTFSSTVETLGLCWIPANFPAGVLCREPFFFIRQDFLFPFVLETVLFVQLFISPVSIEQAPRCYMSWFCSCFHHKRNLFSDYSNIWTIGSL